MPSCPTPLHTHQVKKLVSHWLPSLCLTCPAYFPPHRPQIKKLFSRCIVVGRSFPVCQVYAEGMMLEVRLRLLLLVVCGWRLLMVLLWPLLLLVVCSTALLLMHAGWELEFTQRT